MPTSHPQSPDSLDLIQQKPVLSEQNIDEASDSTAGKPTPVAILTRRHQQATGWLTLVLILFLASHWILEFRRRGKMINVERPFESKPIQLLIDLNSAEWPELTLLPDVSETMARRIVEFRDTNGRFESIDQLQQVSGIGPVTYARVKRYLSPVSQPTR